MTLDNYTELYEAIYLYDKIRSNDKLHSKDSIHPSVYQALSRIFFTNQLITTNDEIFSMTSAQEDQYLRLLAIVNSRIASSNSELLHFQTFYNKAINTEQFFFDHIEPEDYEIYSRCDFPITYNTGLTVAENITFGNKRVLELGGNSGGLATAIVRANKGCRYTIVDTEIPCKIGKAFKKANKVKIDFIASDLFDLELPNVRYDYVILMNLLHDFDDVKCKSIFDNCIDAYHQNTKFIVIEDVLTSECEPKAIIMHGLRLSVECRGGRQRTKAQLTQLFSHINFDLKETIQLSQINTMLVFGAVN